MCKFRDRVCREQNNLDADGMCVSHCDLGLAIHKRMRELAMSNELTTNAIERLFKGMEDHNEQHHNIPKPINTHKGNGVYQGIFAFTLTKSPDDNLTEEDMVKAVTKIMNQKSIPVKKFAWYLEYGDLELKKHPHIHGLYETETGGMIETKHWKRAWSIWNPKQKLGNGFRGGYHRPVRDNEGYDDYIAKQGLQCERYNC